MFDQVVHFHQDAAKFVALNLLMVATNTDSLIFLVLNVAATIAFDSNYDYS